MKKKNTKYLVILLVVAILIGVGYAALSVTLNITGQTTIEKASWDIHFENLKVTDGSITATTPASIDANSTTVNFGVTLTNPGDYYEFTVEEVNRGTIDAMVSTVSKTGLTEEQAKYLNYTVTYSDGTIVSEKQLLSSNQKETVKVRVEFKEDIAASDLPTGETILNLSFSLNYIQADDSAVTIREASVCRRATTLHTEICSLEADSYGKFCGGAGYSIGDTITYGNLGTIGVLTSGDAFDCDVNGDGVYDSETERFYYVSDKDADSSSDYVTLIYYSSVSGGIANNSVNCKYNANKLLSPQTALLQLPTTAQWNNISLSNTTRDMIDETGTVRVTNFSYEGYAARLLTLQEVSNSCGVTSESLNVGDLDSCEFLFENTKYSTTSGVKDSYWLETPITSHGGNHALAISGGRRSIHYFPVDNDYYGPQNVRPAIEVPKSKITY